MRRLKAHFPEAELNFITRPAYLPVVEAMEGVTRALAYPAVAAKTGTETRPPETSIVIDLQNNLRSRLLTRSLHPKAVFRFHRLRFNRAARIHLPGLRKSLSTPPPVAIQYLQTAAPLGVCDDGGSAALTLKESWKKSASERLEELALTGKFGSGRLLMAAPGGRHGTKIWPVEKWVEFFKLAFIEGFDRQLLIGSKEDAAVGDAIAAQLNHSVANFAGRTDLGMLMGLIAQADVFVSGDSGPMHLAAGLGTPVAAIFGPTVTQFGFAPFRSPSRVVQVDDLPCRPCHPHGPEKCPLDHFACMKDISAEMAMNAIRELMAERAL